MVDTVKGLYPYALAEGEGVGTAYEYRAKSAVTARVLGGLSAGSRVLVAGLPQKYGTSADFLLHAERCAAVVCVADERPQALDRARGAFETLRRAGRLSRLSVTYRQLSSLRSLPDLGRHDAVLSCEVVQRLSPPDRAEFARAVLAAAPVGAVFVPNADNRSHMTISGLSGAPMSEMRSLFGQASWGYVDMPPFPPGIARTSEQRAAATSGVMEAVAMRLLDAYCASERFVPDAVKERFAHLVFARWAR